MTENPKQKWRTPNLEFTANPKQGALTSLYLSSTLTLLFTTPKSQEPQKELPTVLVEHFDKASLPFPVMVKDMAKGFLSWEDLMCNKFSDLGHSMWEVWQHLPKWAAQGPGECDKCGAGCRPCRWIPVQCPVQLFSCHGNNEVLLSSAFQGLSRCVLASQAFSEGV